ncbi:MAG: methionyl-tRNA formyltransferase [Bacteroidales bacterium]
MKTTPRIVYMGTPRFAVAPLKELLDKGYDVAGVVTAPDKSGGRGLSLTSSDVKNFAISHNIPVLQPVSLKDESFLMQLAALKGNLFIVVAFRMLPKVVWSMPELGTFNLHASLLPDYRGAAPINWAIINGEKETGVTTFLLDEEIDTGDILFQHSCKIESDDDFGSLHDKLMVIGTHLVIKTVDCLVGGKHKPMLQSGLEAQMGETHLAPKLNKETGKIDWNNSPEKIHNLIRGLSPYPAAHSVIQSGESLFPVKIFSCRFLYEDHDLQYGTIVSDGKKTLRVACNGGFVDITELQLAGKKRLSCKEFLSGFRNIGNYRFES